MPPNARHTASTMAGVVVSSSAMPSVPWPIRRLIFSARARATISPCCLAGIHRHGIEKRVRPWRESELAQSRRQHGGAAMHRARDVGQSFRPVIDRVHRGDDRQQHLRGADVGGRFLAADVLLAGLQRQPIGRLSARIDRQAHDAPRQRALQRIAHRHIGRVRPAISHRHTKALRRSDRDVGAEFARRGQQRQRLRDRRRQWRARPWRAALMIAGRRSRTAPEVAGYCSNPPNTSALIEIASRDRRQSDSIPMARPGCAARPASADAPRRRRRTTLSSSSPGLRAPPAPSLRPPRSPRRAARRWRRRGPVRSQIMVWKLNRASSRPWLISGWYGV